MVRNARIAPALRSGVQLRQQVAEEPPKQHWSQDLLLVARDCLRGLVLPQDSALQELDHALHLLQRHLLLLLRRCLWL